MNKVMLDLYTDYLLSTFGFSTATGLSAMIEGEVSHDKITRFLSAQDYTSKELWQQVKSTVRSVEDEQGCRSLFLMGALVVLATRALLRTIAMQARKATHAHEI